nr:hypothetical protein GCM10025699_09460 [Microbacterium flavescens]
MPAHRLMSYTETAALVDASSDPRMGPVRDVFAELAAARSVDVVEFAAARGGGSGVSPSSEAGG